MNFFYKMICIINKKMNTNNDKEMKYPSKQVTIPCNPPCIPRPMIGTSWHKLHGYPSPCGCAWVVENTEDTEDCDLCEVCNLPYQDCNQDPRFEMCGGCSECDTCDRGITHFKDLQENEEGYMQCKECRNKH